MRIRRCYDMVEGSVVTYSGELECSKSSWLWYKTKNKKQNKWLTSVLYLGVISVGGILFISSLENTC